MAIQTNRDLYLSIAKFVDKQKVAHCTLEEYLCSLWSLASTYQDRSELLLIEFHDLLFNSFSSRFPFKESWRQLYIEDNSTILDYPGWQATILRQIVDLRKMDEKGILKDELKYLGLDSPRGHSWYNFDPITFLECAMAGTYGGWRDGDETGRIFLQGRKHTSDLEYPIVQVNWNDFRRFLLSGQMYE